MSGGELSSAATRHRWDWYVDESWCADKLIETLQGPLCGGYEDWFAGDLIWDPCCGMGNTLRPFLDRGMWVAGSDIEKRTSDALFLFEHDFIGDQASLLDGRPDTSIVFNPPYSVQNGHKVRGLAEKFIRKAIELHANTVAALLPVKWLASEGRHTLFNEHVPRFVMILCERPSMPPGDVVEALGDNAFKHGKVDFMWVVWDRHVDLEPGETRTIWIEPRPKVRKVRK
jgi:hypothetical protein